MPIKRVPLNISLPNEEEKQRIVDYCQNVKGKSVSQYIQEHFRRVIRKNV